jgi:hypothetical protein
MKYGKYLVAHKYLGAHLWNTHFKIIRWYVFLCVYARPQMMCPNICDNVRFEKLQAYTFFNKQNPVQDEQDC